MLGSGSANTIVDNGTITASLGAFADHFDDLKGAAHQSVLGATLSNLVVERGHHVGVVRNDRCAGRRQIQYMEVSSVSAVVSQLP